MFDSIIESVYAATGKEFLICSGVSLILGLLLALVHMYKNEYSKNMIIMLVILPFAVQTMLMLVKGSFGTSIAVMGAFSLVRFRSTPGNAREISSILCGVTMGLATSLGYVGIAVCVFVFMSVVTLVLTTLNFGVKRNCDRTLKITIPEDLDYEGVFDDIFDKYTSKCESIKVRTTNMGSLYELTFNIVLKKDVREKKFIDEIRCRNGNLTVSCGRPVTPKDEL